MEEANTIIDKRWIGGLFHLYNTEDTWDQWLNDCEYDYQWDPAMAEKFVKVVGHNQQYIKDKNVVDLACNLGYFTLSCSSVGAKRVLGVEVRQKYIDVFNKIKSHWPLDNVDMVYANIEKPNELDQILKGFDTILYTGHLYHTVNHLAILQAFTASSATCVIIDSLLPYPGGEMVENIEDVSDPLNGFIDENTDHVPARAPSIEQVKTMLTTLGWSIVQEEIIAKSSPQRFVMTATKIKERQV